MVEKRNGICSVPHTACNGMQSAVEEGAQTWEELWVEMGRRESWACSEKLTK